MEQKEFQNLLLQTVICSIACDGDIDDREIAELHKMINHAQYFKGFDGHEFLDDMLQSVKTDGRAFLGEYFDLLDKSDLPSVQELLVLEVILRIIQADERLDDNEVTFLKLVRSNFNVHDEIIHQRFGNVPYLTGVRSGQFISSNSLQDVNALADKIDRVAEDENKFNGLFDGFLEKTSELKIGGEKEH
jgi:hypothetical protein